MRFFRGPGVIFQGFPGFVGPFYKHFAYGCIFAESVNIRCHFEAFLFQNALVGIGISTAISLLA